MHAGTFDVAVSGVLFVLALVLLAFTMLVWVVRANYDERPLWIVRTTLTMIVARPLCTLLQIGLALLAILAWAAMAGSAHGVRHVAADVLHCVDRVLVRPDSGNGHP